MIKALSKFFTVIATVIVLASCDPEYALKGGGFEYKGETRADTVTAKRKVREPRKGDYDAKRLKGAVYGDMFIITYEGHEYFLYRGTECCSMVHSESCPCKRKKEAIIE